MNMEFSIPVMDVRPVIAALALLVLVVVVTFLLKLYKARMLFVQLQRQGLVSSDQVYIDPFRPAPCAICFADLRCSLCHHTVFSSAISG